MVSTSPYGLIEAAPPKWGPQEDRAASAFVGITFYLCLETTFEIFRVFKKRRGLYFWAILVGVIACAVDNIAVLVKFLVPGSTNVWPFYTLFALCGWTCYSLAQLLVLYSRLHLVVDNHQIQRWVLYLIVACAFFLNLPTWIVVWPAWNINEKVTESWSPADAIVERFTQLGFTLAECVISGIYIHALLRLLSYKPNVRQRRVFLDLVYVNVVTVFLDVLSTILVYLNQTGTSHPIQTFSYILKFRLEFAVLNQLMAVAARGLRRETFGEKRYHDDTLDDSLYSGDKHQHAHLDGRPEHSRENLSKPDRSKLPKGDTEIAVPAPVLEAMGSRSRSRQVLDDDSDVPLQGSKSDAPDAAKHTGTGSKARAVARALRPRPHHDGGDGDGAKSVKARRKRGSTSWINDDDDDDDDEIPLHMWERNGEVVLRIPWLAGEHTDKV